MELRVGGVYKNRRGGVRKIIKEEPKDSVSSYKYQDDSLEWYREDGRYFSEGESPLDLIEEVIVTTQTKEDVMEVRMDGKYRTRGGRNVRRILCVDAIHKQPVVAEIEDGDLLRYTLEGKWDIWAESLNDLIEVQEPKHRAWTNEEVPLGATVKGKRDNIRSLITAIRGNSDCSIDLGSGEVITPKDLFTHYEVLVYGEWKPCGVLE